MGIKHLNKFLRDTCSRQSISCISMKELAGKTIAIDISIYMYKYHTEGTLIENIYLMLSIFRHYGVIPVFIFDGKPPAEKKALLTKRYMNKVAAEKEFLDLQKQLEGNTDEHDKQEIITSMDSLKKQFIYIKKDQIEKVKALITAYGAVYHDAPGEADELCASLVLKKKVWACLSEDMDMFVYGTTRVLRYFSLVNHTVVLYNMKGILSDLGITQKELREICILSGTDYNSELHHQLHAILKLFKKYHKHHKKNEQTFYEYVVESQNHKEEHDFDKWLKINAMFEHIAVDDNICIRSGSIDKSEINKILVEDGFVICA